MASTIRLVAFTLLSLSASSLAKPVVYGGAADPECPVIPESCSAVVAASLCGPTTVTSFVSTVTNLHTVTRDSSPSTGEPSTVTVTVTSNPTQGALSSTVPISVAPSQSPAGSVSSIGFVSPSGTAPSPIIDTIIPSSPSVNTITLTFTESGTVLTRTHTVTNAQPSNSAAISPVASAAESSLPLFTITRVVTESGIAHTITHTQTRSPLPIASASDISSVVSSASPTVETPNSVVTVTMTFGEGTVRTFTQTMTDSPPFSTAPPINSTETSCPAPTIIFQTVTETITPVTATVTLDISTDSNGNTLTRTHTFINTPINTVTELNSNTLTRTHTFTNSPASTGSGSPISTDESSIPFSRLTTRILIPGPAIQTPSPLSTWESTISAFNAASTPCDDENMWTTDSAWNADPTNTNSDAAVAKWAGNENGDWDDEDGSWDGKDGDWDAQDGKWDAEHTGTWEGKDGNGNGEWDGNWDSKPTGKKNGHWKREREQWTGKAHAEYPAAKETEVVMKETATKKWSAYGW